MLSWLIVGSLPLVRAMPGRGIQLCRVPVDALAMRVVGRLPASLARARGERGQSVVIVVAALVSLLGMCALVIDVGYAYSLKRRAQGAADATALSAVQWLPDTTAAATAFTSYAS